MTERIANLGMYDWPETREALDHLWTLIAGNLMLEGVEAPPALTRTGIAMHDMWTHPKLLVGQTCGWPYVSRLRGKTIPFGRFHYALEECPAGYYQSVYVGRSADDKRLLEDRNSLLAADKIAINGDDSQSGFHVFKEITGEFSPDAIEQRKRFVSGSHRASIKAVANGDAQIAAIDAVAFELAKRHDAEIVDKVFVIGKSKPKPGLPLITAPARSANTETLFKAVQQAVRNLDEAHRETLLVLDVVPATDEDYEEFL